MRRLFLFLLGYLGALLLPGCLFDVSPDGSQIVASSSIWKSGASGETPLFISSVDGGELKEVPESTGAFFPAWSPDGSTIAFRKDSVPPRETRELWLFDTKTKASTKVKGDLTQELQYFWSPDSKSLVSFSTPERSTSRPPTTFSWIDVAQQKVTRRLTLAKGNSLAIEHPILWLPHSNEIAWIGVKVDQTGGHSDVYVSTPQGPKPLTTTGDVVAFAFSPQGRVVWARLPRDKMFKDIFVFSASITGGDVHRVALGGALPTAAPRAERYLDPSISFSPDASCLLLADTFLAPADAKTRKKQEFIACYLMSLDGTPPKRIYQSAAFNSRFSGEENWSSGPAALGKWSWEGKRLALCVQVKNGGEMYLFDGAGTHGRRLPLPPNSKARDVGALLSP